MGLLQRALETYENNETLVGKIEPNKVPLEPIGHITVSANVEIILDNDGNYINSNLLKEKEKIIIPITDASVSRSGKAVDNNIHPHMLCDQLSYLGLDSILCEVYLRQLKEWKDSKFSHPLLEAVYKYVSTKNIITNLNQMLESEVSNKNSHKIKIDKSWLIRWIVILDGNPIKCWESKEVINNYTNYYLSKLDYSKNLCMITGNTTQVINNSNHRKGIIPSCGGNAKLISANDTSYFTYRGRFKNDVEAFTVSAIDLSKANSALKWLAENQGVSIKYGNITYLYWKPEGIKLKASPFDALIGHKSEIRPSDYKKELYKTIMGYTEASTDASNIVIACFGAATTGRLSINYYSEFIESDYYKRLESWDESCYWWSFNLKTKKYEIATPDLKSIAIYAFGTYIKDTYKFDLKDEILGKRIQELLQCRINKAKLPYAYVKTLLNKVEKLFLYKDDRISKENLLFITCAIIQKYYIDNNKGELNMDGIDRDRNDISYHYGRLLAVLEKIERDTYNCDEKRIPYAIRVQTKFIQNPLTTFRKIHEKLNIAYIAKLSLASQTYYKKLLADIVADLEKCDGYEKLMDKPLQPTYIIGYFMQNKELYSKKDEKKELEEK